jgi:hypothetical protein
MVLSQLKKDIIYKRINNINNLIGNTYAKTIDQSYERLIKLKKYYKNKKCIILTCGPSLNEYIKCLDKIIDEDTILICVKTSFDLVGICDFYIPGEVCNLRNKNNISFGIHNSKRQFINKTHLLLHTEGKREKMLYDIVKNKDSFSFEKNALKSSNNMLCHLGHAMHGVALPLAVHLGIKHICVIGWDGHIKGRPSHFDKKTNYDFTEYGSKAIIECNKIFPDFLYRNYGVKLYKMNKYSLYKNIQNITVE